MYTIHIYIYIYIYVCIYIYVYMCISLFGSTWVAGICLRIVLGSMTDGSLEKVLS